MTDLIGWIQERPVWIQYAAKQLIDSGAINREDINNLVELTIKQAKKEDCENISIDDLSFGQNSTNEIKLTSISDIQGINALAPKKPLKFGDENLSIIYGRNGSGKSGYVILLKHITGSRNPGNLLSNVYESAPVDKKCKVTYEINDQKKEFDWYKKDGAVEDLLSVDIYDASTGVVYLKDKNEVTYEPPLLRFFSDLIEISQIIGEEIESIIDRKVSHKPDLPSKYFETELGKWYQDISTELNEEEIEKKIKWGDEDEVDLEKLKDRVATESPDEKAAKLLAKRKRLIKFVLKTIQHAKNISDNKCSKIIDLKDLLRKKEKVAEAASDKLFSSSPLDGIGSDVWIELWEKAKSYSEGIAYQGQKFPVTVKDARCVLCQQELSDEAKGRFKSFEGYVKGETNKDVELLSKKLENLLEEISELPSNEMIITELDAIGIDDKERREKVIQLYESFRKRGSELITIQRIENLTPLSNEVDLAFEAKSYASDLLIQANLYLEDAKTANREEIQGLLKEIEVRKWLSTQTEAINSEVERLSELEVLENAKNLTNPASLSRKKGVLAEELITDAYVKRFNEELEALGARNLKVAIKKTGVKKGQVLHEIQLIDSEKLDPSEVLSEGETRIVTLAAFLADVTGKEIPAPFIFDDPITSLDEDYEEMVVDRLVKLSENRQVIIFTHRLSLVSLLDQFSKKEGLDSCFIGIRKENWGTGNPGNTPINVKRPDRVLNTLISNRLSPARKVYEKEGVEPYEHLAKSMCSDFRILLERMIENVLMADVVHRFRRSVQTDNKIKKLSKINSHDCELFDKLMTKYSKYEHSQSRSTPVHMPTPDELEADFEKLKNWHADFTTR